ncbi:hypothetical protein FRB95_012730 [Tulasnella sp. JGI-2019a]|nr:hypothetical protein FRB95_012730 [Tulasnella sp. JGI-2019a]
MEATQENSKQCLGPHLPKSIQLTSGFSNRQQAQQSLDQACSGGGPTTQSKTHSNTTTLNCLKHAELQKHLEHESLALLSDIQTINSSTAQHDGFDPLDLLEQLPIKDSMGSDPWEDDFVEEGLYTMGSVEDAVAAVVDSAYGPYVEKAQSMKKKQW